MKPVQLAVALLIVCISCAEALKCNRCVPLRPGGTCITTVEECGWREDVCISTVISVPSMGSHFRRCSNEGDARTMDASPYINVHICHYDLCN